jgi:futalosine hydrolase
LFKNNIFNILMTGRDMNMPSRDILIAVAHPSEEEAVRHAVTHTHVDCDILVTGVGGPAMAWALQKYFSEGPVPSLVIGAGIAGSYRASLNTGSVVIAHSDCFADMGIDDNGTFLPLFRSGMKGPDSYPFTEGRIYCSGRWFDHLTGKFSAVTAATVNMSSGSQAVIDRIRLTWDPDIETMEGAWLAYLCAMSRTDWLSVRAISNMVEPRNPEKWNIPLALQQLRQAMTGILKLIEKG